MAGFVEWISNFRVPWLFETLQKEIWAMKLKLTDFQQSNRGVVDWLIS